jgi:hypothetical protein
LEKFSASIEYLLRENILFAIDPEVGEALLGRIKYFSEIAQGALFVEDLVGLRKLLSIVTRGATGFVHFAQTFHLVQEPLASSLAIFRIEIVFLIRALFKVITHHDCVFK